MQTHAAAITSPTQEKLIGETLRSLNSNSEKYYILFRLIIETGMSCQYAVSLYIKDVKGKDTISNSEDNTSISLKEPFLSELATFINNRSEEDYLFLNAKGTGPLPPVAFQYALKTVGEKLGIQQLNINRLKKTFSYHSYLDKEVPKSEKRHYVLKKSSDHEVKKYLGITQKVVSQNLPSIKPFNARRTLEEDKFGLKTIDDFQEKLNILSNQLSEPYMPDSFYNETLKLVSELLDVFSHYEIPILPPDF